MSDYIDRQAAIDAIPEVEADIFENCGRCELLTKEDVVEILQGLPSAEVEPVKRGKWIPLEEEIGLYECSICGHKILRVECNYCPNCGAKMEPISASTENGQEVEE